MKTGEQYQLIVLEKNSDTKYKVQNTIDNSTGILLVKGNLKIKKDGTTIGWYSTFNNGV